MTGSQVTKYYFAGTTRIAMRKYTIPQSMSVEYLLGDHLGSTSITTDANGAKVSEMRYKAWGEVRYSWTSGQSTTPAYELAKYTFTGQYSDSYINLLWYGSRHYDPALGRFTSPDSIVPLVSQGVQAWDRFAYTNNNPLKYTDPTGHDVCDEDGNCHDANKGWYLAPGATKWNYTRIIRSGYSNWEAQILLILYEEGGRDGRHSANYIMTHDVHIRVGEPFRYVQYSSGGWAFDGDWQSVFSIGAWFDLENNVVYLNPNSPGFQYGVLPSNYALANVVHESIHILQGSKFPTAYGELEAWQAGFRVLDALNGNDPLSPTQQDIVALPLNHDRGNLFTALNLMLKDQRGRYLGAYPLYIQVLFNP